MGAPTNKSKKSRTEETEKQMELKQKPSRLLGAVDCYGTAEGVRLSVFDAAVNVRVAWIDCPAGRTVFCWFHVRVRYVLAWLGSNCLRSWLVFLLRCRCF